ncbi:RNAse l inhibitor protein 2 [Artemisia annua]|uniref:RNAse l inhibitor protein 2 n=1 Tax=Artemisia annua TaxID=35608 RepID=A0A2U1L4E2_ARTAN|nr:RNAse l inhibitor protein 2 [Artemisia annua]
MTMFAKFDFVFAAGGDGNVFKYPTMTKTGAGFKLKVVEGEFTDSERGLMEPDDTVDGSKVNIPKYYSSHKPQMRIEPYVRSVSSALHDEIPYTYLDPVFVSQVMEPLQIDQLMDTSLCDLSDNESQRLALCLCLGRRAHIYLIDEPSANLTPQQRIVAARVIKRFIQRTNSTAFVVEHDSAMVEHLADKVIVFEGTPAAAKWYGIELGTRQVKQEPMMLIHQVKLSLFSTIGNCIRETNNCLRKSAGIIAELDSLVKEFISADSDGKKAVDAKIEEEVGKLTCSSARNDVSPEFVENFVKDHFLPATFVDYRKGVQKAISSKFSGTFRNDVSPEFVENFVKDHFLPATFVDYRKGVQKAISIPVRVPSSSLTLSGAKTGSSPMERRVVKDKIAEDELWWEKGSPNIETDEHTFLVNRERVVDYLCLLDKIFDPYYKNHGPQGFEKVEAQQGNYLAKCFNRMKEYEHKVHLDLEILTDTLLNHLSTKTLVIVFNI